MGLVVRATLQQLLLAMPKQLRPKDGLRPTCRRSGGHLWPPERQICLQTLEKRVRSQCPEQDPFTTSERRYLCSRLPHMEADPRGVECPIARIRSPGARSFAPSVMSLLAKGFVEIRREGRHDVAVLTNDGCTGLRKLFMRQLSDHALLYPELHCQLGIDALVRT